MLAVLLLVAVQAASGGAFIQPALTVQDIRASAPDENGRIKLFLKARQHRTGETYINFISIVLPRETFGREVKVLDAVQEHQLSGEPMKDIRGLYLVYENFDAQAAQRERMPGGWFPERTTRTMLRVPLEGPALAVEKGLTLVVGRPKDQSEDDEGFRVCQPAIRAVYAP